jgi:predicted ribosomally synthesized peptide with SipW-like signal peptide
MRRPLLGSLMVLSLVTTAVGGMGVFAPFTDRATTGLNTVSSGERPKAADLKLAFPVDDFSTCTTSATYSDNLTTAGIVASDVQPAYRDIKYFCLRNAGSAALTVSASVIDVTDVDTACTGDEAAGDTTCGGDAAGELGTVLYGFVSRFPCQGGASDVNVDIGFLGNASPAPLGTVAAGATVCGFVEVDYPQNRPLEDVLNAQSDTLTWKYAFNGTT